MRYLALSDQLLGLTDLFDNRHASLVLSSSGKTYEPMLKKRLTALSALPAALVGGKPLAEQLSETDVVHDGAGGAVWHTTEAYLRHTRVSKEVVDAAKRVRAAFIPSMSDLIASYATEAEAALRRQETLKEHKADLQMFKLADGQTLYDWVKDFLDAGVALHTLLGERSLVEAGGREGAGKLRGETLGLLNRFRDALGDEVADNAKLPRNLDHLVFSYFDELEGMRQKQVAAQAAAAKAAKAAKAGATAAKPDGASEGAVATTAPTPPTK